MLSTWWCRSQVLAGWDTSHVCSSRLRTRALSGHVAAASWWHVARLDSSPFMCFSWEKCMDMSTQI